MAKRLIKQIDNITALYINDRTGIAFVEDGHTGQTHSCHANIDSSGSIRGMKKMGYWRKDAKTVKCNGTIYNISSLVVSTELDELARKHCKCGGQH